MILQNQQTNKPTNQHLPAFARICQDLWAYMFKSVWFQPLAPVYDFADCSRWVEELQASQDERKLVELLMLDVFAGLTVDQLKTDINKYWSIYQAKLDVQRRVGNMKR